MPVLRFHWLTPWYDLLSKWLLPEYAFKHHLIRQVSPLLEARILDFGCGTGTLTIWLAQLYPSVWVHGLDVDPKVLQLASQKIHQENVSNLQLHTYYPPLLPFPDNSFDHITSSLVFCNLTSEQKVESLGELYRVLKPGGQLHVAEWGKPTTVSTRVGFFFLQALGGFQTTQDLAKGVFLPLLHKIGFSRVQEVDKMRTLTGEIYFYLAVK